MHLQTIGVIGAGTMGNGIAQVCALAGFEVTLLDISASALEKKPWPTWPRTSIGKSPSRP
nr:hypothetical protein GCM10020185_85300 [Pseudomonas brassicacearum subsp. brassicacearum]